MVDITNIEIELNKELVAEINKLRAALQISTNGLRHCAHWNISEEKKNALMAVVMENETLLY